MHGPGRLNIYRCIAVTLLVGVMLSALSPAPSWAKRAKLDKESVAMAEALASDREAAWVDEAAMSTEEFQKTWSAFASGLDRKYAGKEVKLGKFGSHIRIRQQFTLFLYAGLRSQVKGVVLEPSTEELVARHSFLQMLMLEGSCYIRNNRYPNKMVDFIDLYPKMATMIHEYIDDWEPGYRKAFKEVFPTEAAGRTD
jgi:hypothetical protein